MDIETLRRMVSERLPVLCMPVNKVSEQSKNNEKIHFISHQSYALAQIQAIKVIAS